MAKLGNTFRKMFGRLNLTKSGENYNMSLNFTPTGEHIDYAVYKLKEQMWEDIQKYMPFDSGNLIAQTNLLNEVEEGNKVYLYPNELEYGHYQHEGIVYVDPVYGVGAFYNPTYGFWSRPNVEKIPSERPLQYHMNPEATPHWGETAFNNHSREWIRVFKQGLKGR